MIKVFEIHLADSKSNGTTTAAGPCVTTRDRPTPATTLLTLFARHSPLLEPIKFAISPAGILKPLTEYISGPRFHPRPIARMRRPRLVLFAVVVTALLVAGEGGASSLRGQQDSSQSGGGEHMLTAEEVNALLQARRAASPGK